MFPVKSSPANACKPRKGISSPYSAKRGYVRYSAEAARRSRIWPALDCGSVAGPVAFALLLQRLLEGGLRLVGQLGGVVGQLNRGRRLLCLLLLCRLGGSGGLCWRLLSWDVAEE